MYCNKCGNKLDDADIYCSICGNNVTEIVKQGSEIKPQSGEVSAQSIEVKQQSSEVEQGNNKDANRISEIVFNGISANFNYEND